MELYLAAMAAGIILDVCLGDPHRFPHPVRAIGWLIEKTENRVRPLFPASARGESAAGIFFAGIILFITGAAVCFILRTSWRISPFLGAAAEAILTYYLLAARSLRDESMKVYRALSEGDTKKARQAVSMIVGRDTERLDGAGIARAAVETVAENTSDGVIAPLFYLALGGPAAGWIYKAVNTMDSMVGYRNEKYMFFGRAAARLDDAVNFLPSRLSALFMITAAFLLRMDGKNAFCIWKRDRRNHKSPNSAQTEAACAGALGIRLAGDAWYFGSLVKKPYIGDDLRPVETEDIRRANRLMGTAAAMAACAALAVRWFLLSGI